MRKLYIDNIRWATVLLVIVYHVIYTFNSVGVITNITDKGIPALDCLLSFVYPWFMCLLFAVAGMSAYYALQNKTGREFAKSRAKRLLVPSICGIFIIGWFSGWVTDQTVDMFGENRDVIPGFVKYLIYCFSGICPLCFDHELFLASMILLLVRKLDKSGNLYELGGKVKFPVLLALGIAVWFSSLLFNTPLIEVYRNGIYVFMFLLGYYVFSHENITDTLVKFKIPLLIAAVAMGISYTAFLYGQNYTAKTCLQSVFTNVYAWLAILAIIGCAKAWADKENKFTRYMTKRNFGFYALHYPVMMMVAYPMITFFDLPPALNYIFLLLGTVILLVPVYEILSRIPVIKTLVLGISGKTKNK
ncbi:MAG: acyltransferase [Oscillospiraceae bacterium]|nr:acyltransferase [Oscillospiraceae bacterium]